jgi:hypothetical protein
MKKYMLGFGFHQSNTQTIRVSTGNVRSLCPVLNQFQTLQVSFELAIAPLVKLAILSMNRRPFIVGTN